jgi:hypothetical protein
MSDEQIQCCLYYPGRGLETDTVRLVSIEADAWAALAGAIPAAEDRFDVLGELVAAELPVHLQRSALEQLAGELSGAGFEDLPEKSAGAIMALAMFADQAVRQRQAEAAIMTWPGQRFEQQVFLPEGTDVLGDLQANAGQGSDE